MKNKVYIASDHAGYELKNKYITYINSLGYEAVDNGPFLYDAQDDYPDFITPCAQAVAKDWDGGMTSSMGVILGGSGQGEAMCANRVKGARAGVYYGGQGTQTDMSGNTINMISSLREHNNANILSIGARFISESEIQEAIKSFLSTPFSEDPRHIRRINKF